MTAVSLSSIKSSPAGKPPVSLNGRVFANQRSLGGLEEQVQGILSGSMTAATYKDILTLTSPGVLKFAAVRPESTVTRTITLKLTIDGVAAFEVSGASTTANFGFVAVGGYATIAFESIPFNTLTVSIKGTVTETDKLNTFVVYNLVA